MNAEIFAEWLRRQGHRVHRTPSSYWFDQGPRVYQAFPYHWIFFPQPGELDGFLKAQGAVGLRYSTPLEADEGAASYHAVYEGGQYGFENLGKWARKNVRRGLKSCRVEPVTFDCLAAEGFELQLDTLDRQGRRLGLEQKAWQTRCLAAGELPGFEAWGAWVDGTEGAARLAASVITFQMDDCAYMLYQQCRREYLAEHVNNALGFVVTQTLTARQQVRSILYGLHSLDAPASVDEFKFRMGYRAKAVRQRVVFHPLLRPLFTPLTHAALRDLRGLRPASATLAKTEGLVRFYLQGRLPLTRQVQPDALKSAFEEAPENS